MEVTYELEGRDYVDSSALAARQKLTVFIFDVLFTASLFVVCAICFGLRHFAIGILLAVVGWCYMIKRIYSWKTLRLSKESAHERDIITLKFSEEDLEYKTRTTTFRSQWQSFSHIIEDGSRFLLILRGQRIFLIVPKRAFVNEQCMNEARRYFERINPKDEVSPITKSR
ncbi:YcxB family protein [bacterium]|nr:MAG: YcxB family protein [bacterium]